MSEALVAPLPLHLVPTPASSCSLKRRNAAAHSSGRAGKRHVPCARDADFPPTSCMGQAVGSRSTALDCTGCHDPVGQILVAVRIPWENQATCPGGWQHTTARAMAWLRSVLLAWLLLPLVALAAWPLAHWRRWQHRSEQHVSRNAAAEAPEAPPVVAVSPAASAAQTGHSLPGTTPGQVRTGRTAGHHRLGHDAPGAHLPHPSDGWERVPEPEAAVGRARVHARRTVTWAASTVTRPTPSCRTGHSASLRAAATTAAPPVATAVPAYGAAMPDGVPAGPRRDPLPYNARTAWSSTRVKISGADPSQLPRGYAGRVTGVVAAAGLQVAGVYVRRGCIELTVDAVDMGQGQGQAPAGAAASGSNPAAGVTGDRDRSTVCGSAVAQPSAGTGLQPHPPSSGPSSSSSTGQGGASYSHIATPQNAPDGRASDESTRGRVAAHSPASPPGNRQRPSAPEPPSDPHAAPGTSWEPLDGDPGCLGGGEGAGGWASGSAWRGMSDGRLSGNGRRGSTASGSNASDGSLHGDPRGSACPSRENLSRPSGSLPRVSLRTSVGAHAYPGRSSNEGTFLDNDQGPLVESLLSSGAGSGCLYGLGGKGSGTGAGGLGSGGRSGGSVRRLLGSVEVEALIDALQLPDFDLEGELAAEDHGPDGDGSGGDGGVEVLSAASAGPTGSGGRGSAGSVPSMRSGRSRSVNSGGMQGDFGRPLSRQESGLLSPSLAASEGDAPGAFDAPAPVVLCPSLVALHPRVLWLGQEPQSPAMSAPHLQAQQQVQQEPPSVDVTVQWEAVPLGRAQPNSGAPTADAAIPTALHALSQGAVAAPVAAPDTAEPTPTRLSLRSQGRYAAFEVACPDRAALAADGADVTSWDAVYSVPLSALGPGLGPGVLLGEVLPGAAPDAGPEGTVPQQVASVPAALPVLLVDDPRVARELQAAVDGWYGDSAEVDALLLDVGALLRAQEDLAEALAAVAAAATASADPHGDGRASAVAAAAAAGAALQAASERLEGLYDHLQGYVQASGWYCTAAWLARRQETALGVELGLAEQQQGPWEAARGPADRDSSGGSRQVPGVEEDLWEELPTRGSRAEAAAAVVAAARAAEASSEGRLSLTLSAQCSTEEDLVLGSCGEQQLAAGSMAGAQHVVQAALVPVLAGETGPAALRGGALALMDTGEGGRGLGVGLTMERAAADVPSSSFAPITPAYVRSSSGLEVVALLETQAPHSGSHSGSGSSEITVDEQDAEEEGPRTAEHPGVGEGSGGGSGTGPAGEAGALSWAGEQGDAEGVEWLEMRRSVQARLTGTQQQQQAARSCNSGEERAALQGGLEAVPGAVLESGGCLQITGAHHGHLNAEEHAVAGSAAPSSAAATLPASPRGVAEDGGRSGALRGRGGRPCGVDRNAPLLAWLWQLLQLVVGWRQESPEDAARYRAFVLPTLQTLAFVMHTLEVLFFVATLVRVVRQLPASAPDLPFVFMNGINTVVITALRPFVTRDTWRRVVGASTWPRLLAYTAAKFMAAYLGLKRPDFTAASELSWSQYIVEGVVVPAACLVTPLQALVLGLVKMPIQVRLWHVPRAQYGTAWVVVRSLQINGLSVTTTIIVHMYLRMAGWRDGASSRAKGKQGAEDGEWLGMRHSVEGECAGTQQQQQQNTAGSRSSQEGSCRQRRGGAALQGGQEAVQGAVAGSLTTSDAAATLPASPRGVAEDGGRSGALRGRRGRPCGVDRNAPLLAWLWQLLQLVVGWRQESPEDAARYRAFVLPTLHTLAFVTHTLEVLFVMASLVRLTRQLPASVPDLPFVFVAGATTVVVTVLRPFVTRDTWRRVLSASKWPRLLSYVAGKVMVAYLGFRRPDFAAAGELSGKQFVMEGVVVPAACLVTPLQALVLGLSKIPIQVRLWHVLGAQYDTAHAVRRAVLLNGLTFVTTVTVQMYLRLLYERHAAKLRREKQERSS